MELLAPILIFYLLPAVIAETRKTQHLGAIVMVNLFLGWTILGWVAALLWAIVEEKKPPKPADEHIPARTRSRSRFLRF